MEITLSERWKDKQKERDFTTAFTFANSLTYHYKYLVPCCLKKYLLQLNKI